MQEGIIEERDDVERRALLKRGMMHKGRQYRREG